MKRIFSSIVCLFALLSTSCKSTILEFPEGEGNDPTLVNVHLSLGVDPSIEPYTSATMMVKSDESDTHDVRWIVEIFRDEINGEPVARRILSCDPAADGTHTIETEFSLHAAKYKIVAWMDYVDNGSIDDKYYTINTLAAINVLENENYIGEEEHKDTYVGHSELDLTGYRDQWNETVSHELTLERPMAKIEFITTDIDKLLSELASKRVQSGNSVSESLLADSPDLSSIKVSVGYSGYFPSGFNAYTNKPNDAREGVSFDCAMTPLSDKEGRLGSDYIFVNGSESAVSVNLTIRDDQGNVLNEVQGINVPIVRGKLTTIRDEFLTKDYTPGIGIDPGFDGEINIVIPD